MIWLKSVYGSRPSAMRVSFSRPMPRSRERWMLIAARSIVAGGSDRKFRRSSMMRESSACDGSAPRWRRLAVRAAVVDEVRGRLEEHVLEIVLGPDHLAELVEVLGLAGDNGVPEAEGCAGKFKRDARIDARIVAGVGRDRVGAEQAHQEFRIGDVRDLGRDDGAGLLVELVAGPARIEGLQPVDLVVVLAQEQRLQRGQRGVLGRARIARDEHAARDRQVVPGRVRSDGRRRSAGSRRWRR